MAQRSENRSWFGTVRVPDLGGDYGVVFMDKG